jgi:hypothetical protein
MAVWSISNRQHMQFERRLAMKRYLTYMAIVAGHVLSASLFLGACSSGLPTPTPTPVGTWETVIEGTIFDKLPEPDEPIVGASISYDVLHSYFAELQEGRPHSAITDQFGEFSLPVIVHDTDSIRIMVEAQGYMSYEERLVGFDMVRGRRLDISLSPILTATATSP